MPETSSSPGKALWLLIFSVLILLAVVIFRFPSSQEIPPELQSVLRTHPVSLQDFELTDQNGKSFTLARLKGQTTLLFFGYLSCPDICPTTLATLNQVFRKLHSVPGASDDLQVIFVSVDPQRDSPQKISDYLAYFNPRFIGLSGNRQAIDAFTRQFSAGYMLEEKQADGNYLVSHTSSIFMINPQVEIVAAFSPPHKVNVLVSQYLQIRNM